VLIRYKTWLVENKKKVWKFPKNYFRVTSFESSICNNSCKYQYRKKKVYCLFLFLERIGVLLKKIVLSRKNFLKPESSTNIIIRDDDSYINYVNITLLLQARRISR